MNNFPRLNWGKEQVRIFSKMLDAFFIVISTQCDVLYGVDDKFFEYWNKIGSVALLWRNAKCNINPGLSHFDQCALACAHLLAKHFRFVFCQNQHYHYLLFSEYSKTFFKQNCKFEFHRFSVKSATLTHYAQFLF